VVIPGDTYTILAVALATAGAAPALVIVVTKGCAVFHCIKERRTTSLELAMAATNITTNRISQYQERVQHLRLVACKQKGTVGERRVVGMHLGSHSSLLPRYAPFAPPRLLFSCLQICGREDGCARWRRGINVGRESENMLQYFEVFFCTVKTKLRLTWTSLPHHHFRFALRRLQIRRKMVLKLDV
jgi:hypothetical protein